MARRFIGGRPRVIAAATYEKFARKYGLPARGKSPKALAQSIYNYETRKNVTSGLYYKPA